MFALCAWFFGARCAADDVAGFRRFGCTISPDGAFALAWGWGENADDLAALKEWPAGRDKKDDSISNYLTDAVAGKVLAVIPEHDHYVTSDGDFKRFSGLAVGWAEDSSRALAIYEGRWSNESILWIDPKKRTFTEVLAPLTEAYSRFLKKKDRVADSGEVSFAMPALLPGGVLVIDGRARPMVNKGPEYNYRLRFQVNFDGKEPKCTLVSGRKIPEPPENDKVEDELNKAYQELRAKLKDADRVSLRDRQLQWLKQREALAETDRTFFTRLRAAWLRARAEN